MKKISKDSKSSILSMIDQGISTQKIRKCLGISRFTVYRVRREYRCDIKKPKGGRPKKLTETDKRHLVRMATTQDNATASSLTRSFNSASSIKVSAQSVRNALKEAGLKSAVKSKHPKLSQKNIQARLDFARKYSSWTKEDWRRVVFSDETKINRLGSGGRHWVWKRSSSVLKPQQVQGTVKFGGGSIMLWGCMTTKGVGYSCRIDGNMDSTLYCEILSGEFLDTLEYYRLEVKDVVFQQDNDPKHNSVLAKKWFADNQIETLQWPSHSSDLNPIEHLWRYLKMKLNAYENEPSSIHELWTRIEKEWEAIPASQCLKLIDSMVDRVAAVLDAKGGYTSY